MASAFNSIMYLTEINLTLLINVIILNYEFEKKTSIFFQILGQHFFDEVEQEIDHKKKTQ